MINRYVSRHGKLYKLISFINSVRNLTLNHLLAIETIHWNLSIGCNDNAVCILNGPKAVCNHKCSFFPAKIGEGLLHRCFIFQIKTCRCFIQNKNRRIFQNGPGKRDTLAFAARQVDALRADHDFLTAGGVFPKDLLDTWIEYKYENEVQQMRAFPHPLEFQLYYGV